MPSAISARKLTRRFGRFTAVDAIDLEIPEGALYGFLGLNGAGKSTTIRMLCGLLPPTGGEARVAGHDVVQDTLEVRRRVGLIAELEAAQAHPSWSGREYLRYFAGLWETPGARERAETLLDQVGLAPEWRARPMRGYSTGMRRRVEIARAMLGEPRILFLDEPTRGLDLPAKRDLWEWLRGVVRERRVTLFVSSHEVREIRALCSDLAVIAKGRIAYQGAARALGGTDEAFEDALVKLLQDSERPKGSWGSAG
ncbi:MAG TPA: ABC transporter ATP-binding protein [Candidatus Thermoplasmatota archaeon]|nr:ABC transporter ATP-binding protein [Candidatus Thermoplasmatota archaeon]